MTISTDNRAGEGGPIASIGGQVTGIGTTSGATGIRISGNHGAIEALLVAVDVLGVAVIVQVTVVAMTGGTAVGADIIAIGAGVVFVFVIVYRTDSDTQQRVERRIELIAGVVVTVGTAQADAGGPVIAAAGGDVTGIGAVTATVVGQLATEIDIGALGLVTGVAAGFGVGTVTFVTVNQAAAVDRSEDGVVPQVLGVLVAGWREGVAGGITEQFTDRAGVTVNTGVCHGGIEALPFVGVGVVTAVGGAATGKFIGIADQVMAGSVIFAGDVGGSEVDGAVVVVEMPGTIVGMASHATTDNIGGADMGGMDRGAFVDTGVIHAINVMTGGTATTTIGEGRTVPTLQTGIADLGVLHFVLAIEQTIVRKVTVGTADGGTVLGEAEIVTQLDSAIAVVGSPGINAATGLVGVTGEALVSAATVVRGQLRIAAVTL